jgi:hypothetical protein
MQCTGMSAPWDLSYFYATYDFLREFLPFYPNAATVLAKITRIPAAIGPLQQDTDAGGAWIACPFRNTI